MSKLLGFLRPFWAVKEGKNVSGLLLRKHPPVKSLHRPHPSVQQSEHSFLQAEPKLENIFECRRYFFLRDNRVSVSLSV